MFVWQTLFLRRLLVKRAKERKKKRESLELFFERPLSHSPKRATAMSLSRFILTARLDMEIAGHLLSLVIVCGERQTNFLHLVV